MKGILIRRTYSVVTHGSARVGDFAEHGFLTPQGDRVPIRDSEGEHPENIHGDYDQLVTSFRELIELLEGYEEFSSHPPSATVREWLTTNEGMDWHGEQYSESVHYSQTNPPKNEKYWRLAMLAVWRDRKGA